MVERFRGESGVNPMSMYVGAILLTVLTMVAMTIHVATYAGFTREQKTWYILTFVAVLVCAAGECVAIEFDARGPQLILPLTVITVVQFSLTPMLPVFFAGALGMQREARIAGTVFSLNALALVASAFTGWIFYFDEVGTYIRGEYYIIYESFYIVSLVFLIISMIVVGKRFRHRDRWTIAMVLIVMVLGIVPMILYGIYTDYLCIGISASLCYIYYNDLIQLDTRADIVANQKRISGMQTHIISGLANLIENRDTETGEHVFRTRAYVKLLAEDAMADGVYAAALDERFISLIYTLAPMHDIGKILVSDEILRKPGKLTPEEFRQMQRHAAEGGSVVRGVLSGITDEEYMDFAAQVATYHHERWDGAGYPEGLFGEAIPLAARIMAIADVFDALISERCYKQAMPMEQAFEVIREGAGSHFDPQLVAVFLRHREEFAQISGTTP